MQSSIHVATTPHAEYILIHICVDQLEVLNVTSQNIVQDFLILVDEMCTSRMVSLAHLQMVNSPTVFGQCAGHVIPNASFIMAQVSLS